MSEPVMPPAFVALTSTAAPSAAKSRRKKISRRLTEAQKAEAIALWKAGEVTQEMLAKKFGKSKQTFQRLFDKVGAVKGANKAETHRKVEEAVKNEMLGDVTLLAQRVKETKEQHYNMAVSLAKLTWKIIADTQTEKKAIGTRLNDMKALQTASNVLKTVREERYAVLGLNENVKDEDTPLPELVVQELTAEQVLIMQRQAQQNDNEMALDMPDASLPDLNDLDDELDENDDGEDAA